MDLKLANKTAVVTGASRGIGRGIALMLAQEGVKVAVNYIKDKAAADEVVKKIHDIGSKAVALRADVGMWADAKSMMDEAIRHFGKVDILVNNAGIVSRKSILEVPLDEWDRVVRTNFYGCFYCSRLAGRHMVSRGSGGKIVNISSIHGRVAKADLGPYCSTKASIDMFSKQLAVELAPHGINVNVVAAGTITTDINIPLYKSTRLEDRQLKEAVLKRIPMRRIGDPEDIGRAVAFLSSEAASYITGAVLYVDGGYVAEGTPRVMDGSGVP